MAILDLLQTIGNVFQRCLPVHGLPLTILLEHGRCQSIIAGQGFVRETVAVSNPALVNSVVFERDNTHNFVGLDLHDKV